MQNPLHSITVYLFVFHIAFDTCQILSSLRQFESGCEEKAFLKIGIYYLHVVLENKVISRYLYREIINLVKI